MRALQLFFRLHRAYDLKPIDEIDAEIFGIEAEFRETNRIEYQPLFAILERNSQKYPKLHVSIGVSGLWLEQAEKWDPELIRRLRKLVNLGNVELVACPYYYSLSSFYDEAEFDAQMEAERKIFSRIFGVEPEMLAMPELIYHDKIAAYAEKAKYKGVLAGSMEKILDYRSANQVFEVKDCPNLRVIAENAKFSQAILQANRLIMVEEVKSETEFVAPKPGEVAMEQVSSRVGRHKSTAAEFVRGMAKTAATQTATSGVKTTERTSGRYVFSARKCQKELELESLRGNLINICLDTSIFRKYRDIGVVRFFDELISSWQKDPNNRFLNASEMIASKQPRTQISVKTSVSIRPERAKVGEDGLALGKDIHYRPPEWLSSARQIELEKSLYALREEVLRTNDKKLYEDFARLTALDYLLGLNEEKIQHFEAVQKILRDRILQKLPKPPKLTAEADGKVDIPEAEDFSVKVKRVSRSERKQNVTVADAIAANEAAEQAILDGETDVAPEWDDLVWNTTDWTSVFPDGEDAESDSEDGAEGESEKDAETIAAEQVLAERMSRQMAEMGENVDQMTEAELVNGTADEDANRPKKRKKSHKLVIE